MVIKTYDELLAMPLSGDHSLGGPIDCQHRPHVPIGSSASPFSGTFDGAGFTIRNLNVSLTMKDGVGLFGCCSNAAIKNLVVEGRVEGRNNVGGLVGQSDYTTITNCFVKADISALGDNVGGLVGKLTSRLIMSGCGHSGTVSITKGTSKAVSYGGICGTIMGNKTIGKSTISGCYHVGSCKAANNVGGLVGRVEALPMTLQIHQCYALGSVECVANDNDTSCIGGLVGFNDCASLSDSLALCSIVDTTSTKIPNNHPFMPVCSDPFLGKIENCYAWQGMVLRITQGSKVYGSCPMAFSEVKCVGWAELSGGAGFYEKKLGWDFEQNWVVRSGDYPFPKLLQLISPGIGKIQPVSFDLDPQFPSGDGKSEKTAYVIYMPVQFDLIREDLTAFYRLGRELDFTDYKSPYTADGRLLPIGDAAHPFNGHVDGWEEGDALTITGLTMDLADTDDVGLFGCVGKDGQISGLCVSGLIKGQGNSGLIAGYNLGHISGCMADGIVEGSAAGGIVGSNFGTIVDCGVAHESVVYGLSKAGGVAGENCGVIERCYARCGVKGAGSLGGIVGIHYKLSEGGSIHHCVAAHTPEIIRLGAPVYAGSVSGETWNATSHNFVWDKVAEAKDTKLSIDALTERSFWVEQGYVKESGSETNGWKWDGDFPYL